VPENLRNIIYAFDRSFEMAIAAASNPVVGILAEKLFGFDVSQTPDLVVPIPSCGPSSVGLHTEFFA
jgi:hypothetical protein